MRKRFCTTGYLEYFYRPTKFRAASSYSSSVDLFLSQDGSRVVRNWTHIVAASSSFFLEKGPLLLSLRRVKSHREQVTIYIAQSTFIHEFGWSNLLFPCGHDDSHIHKLISYLPRY